MFLFVLKATITIGLFLFSYIVIAADVNINQIAEEQRIKLAAYYAISTDKSLITIDQIRQNLSWSSIDTMRLSNFSGPAWLKLSLSNPSAKAKDLIWLEKDPKVRQIEFYVFSGDKLLYQFETGEKYPFFTRPIPHNLFPIPFSIQPTQILDIYIRTHTLANIVVKNSELWQESQYLYKDRISDFWQFFYFGILFIMFVYSLLIYLMVKENYYLFYSGFIGSSLLFYFCNSGYAFQFFWPEYPALNQRIIYIAMVFIFAFAGWFSISFLNLKKHYRKITCIINFFILLCIVLLCLYLPQTFDPHYIIIRTIAILSMPVYIFCWTGGFLSWVQAKHKNAKIYTLAWSMLIISSLTSLINDTFLNAIPFNSIILLQITHGIEIMILSITLSTRITELKLKENFARAKVETQSRFLAKMSHEIRTPMNGILGIADLLKERLKNNTNQHYIDVIYTSANTLGKIINDILDYSSIEAGKLKIIKSPFSFHALLDNINTMFDLETQLNSLDFKLEMDNGVPDVLVGDVNRIQQILINLISNAIKYTPSGKITLKVSYQHKCLTCHIIDTGIGIRKSDLSRLFQPFEQMQNHNLSSQKSTGLGLAICQELTEAMNGNITVTSKLDSGSCFTLALPLETESSILDDSSINESSCNSFNYQTILVIEDNPTNSLVISAILNKLGINHHVCENGKDGVYYFKKHPDQISLVFMDCEMPVMDGFNSTREIRLFEARNKMAKTPIIALTAHTWPQQLEKCRLSGMNDLLLKPITQELVKDTLHKYNPDTTDTCETVTQI